MKVTKYGVAIIFDGREVDKQWYPTKEKAYNRLKYDSSRKYIGTKEVDLCCERCDKELNLGDNYIKCDEETRYCESCYYIDAFFEEIDEIDSVVFVDGCFKLKRTGFDVCICRSVDDFKIIGNIYENPELLEAIE